MSFIPGAAALPFCHRDSNGYRNCGYATWGVSLGILMLVLLFLGLFCYSSRHYSEREEEIARMNMAYVAQRRDYLATMYDARPVAQDAMSVPSTMAITQSQQQSQPPMQMPVPAPTRRGRPSSLKGPFTTTYERENLNEPTYPATAYPFAGYSVAPPASHGSKVHSAVKNVE